MGSLEMNMVYREEVVSGVSVGTGIQSTATDASVGIPYCGNLNVLLLDT